MFYQDAAERKEGLFSSKPDPARGLIAFQGSIHPQTELIWEGGSMDAAVHFVNSEFTTFSNLLESRIFALADLKIAVLHNSLTPSRITIHARQSLLRF